MTDGHLTRTSTRLVAVAFAVLSLVVLGSCGRAPSSGSAAAEASASVVATPDCRAPQVLAALGALVDGESTGPGSVTDAPHPDVPPAGPVPAGFSPESVMVCSLGGPLRDAQGTWSSVTATQREGDLRPLLAALVSGRSQSAAGCVPGPDALQLWLVDALGQAVRPVVPGTCGVPTRAVTAALAHLTATDSDTYPVRLIVPAPTTWP
jgi:hypothetical protein